jgi:hypothetical protein
MSHISKQQERERVTYIKAAEEGRVPHIQGQQTKEECHIFPSCSLKESITNFFKAADKAKVSHISKQQIKEEWHALQSRR